MKHFCLSIFIVSSLQASSSHLSAFNRNYDAMSVMQLRERERIIRSNVQRREEAWLEEKPWRKPVLCIGMHCCFWIPAIAVSTVEHMESSSFAGLGGLTVGAFCLKSFVDWYKPDLKYSRKELLDIAQALRRKNR